MSKNLTNHQVSLGVPLLPRSKAPPANKEGSGNESESHRVL